MALDPVELIVDGAKELPRKLSRIKKGLNNYAVRMAALNATLVKVRNDLKRQGDMLRRGK